MCQSGAPARDTRSPAIGQLERCWLLIGQTNLLVLASDLGDNEVDYLLDQLTLLPGDGLTGLCSSPHLFPILVSLPVRDAVLFGDVFTVRHHLDVGHGLGSLKLVS